MNPLGIMQGRLCPSYPQRLRAFPWKTWEEEFAHAQVLALDCIELIFEAEGYKLNPLWTRDGVQRIAQLTNAHHVRVNSIYANQSMQHPFFRVPAEERESSIRVLHRLLQQAASLHTRVGLVPVLEVAELRTDAEMELLVDVLHR